MSLPAISVQKKVTTVMVTLGVIGIGIISFTRLPQELFPPITFPQITVVTDYANAAPEEVETLITKPIEEALGSVGGLKRLESISREGRSTVIISFNWGQDIDFAALAVREKIDLVKERLPKESEDPVVLKFDPLARPVMMLSVTGQDLTPIQLKLYAEKILKDNLEKVEGVASASISGGVDREILISVDQGRLEANHLSLLELVDSIEKANVSYPAGSIKKGLYEYLIRTSGEFRSVREIGYAVAGVDTVKKFRRQDTSFVEKGSEGPRDTLDSLREEVDRKMLEKRLVLVRDVAEVIDGLTERTSVSRYDHHENIAISIQKQAGANTIQVVDRVKNAIAALEEDIKGRGLQYNVIYDHSVFIRKSLEDLMSDAQSGGILAFIVLYLFLRAMGPSVIVILSVPITVLGTFFLMNLTGITLNTMSIGGLVLGIGMITDTSIVVLENIFRRRQGGEDAVTAAIKGTDEVMWPVITSNMTTMAVFFPLIAFVPGIAGQIFKDLSWAIIYSQIISTILPLTLVPLLSTYVKVKNMEYKPWHWSGFFDKRLIGDDIPVKNKIRFVVLILLIAVGVCSLAIPMFSVLEKEVLPKVDQGEFLVQVNMPLGTRLEVTDRVCRHLEKIFSEFKEIEHVAVTIGSEKSSQGEVKIETLRASQALMLIKLSKGRKGRSWSLVHTLRERISKLQLENAEVNFVVQESEFAFAEGGGKPISIEVKGYDYKAMQDMVSLVSKEIGKIPGTFDIKSDMGEPVPETKLEIDKRRAALYGISALDISLTAKAAIDGVVSTEYREGGREFDIRVRLGEKDRSNLETLNNLLLYSKVLDTLLPMKEVAAIQRGLGPSEIRHTDQERTITISADIQRDFKSKDVLERVQQSLRDLNITPDSGLQVALSGKAKEVKENFNKVMFAFLLALALNYMIMASQFESFIQPFIIMFTVPLALFGVALILLVTGTSMNVISLLGMILLAGTAVNNGIVLIEYINQKREEGASIEQSALEAAVVRTRPILMSALTSVVGLVPLALGLGEGAELRSPMAKAMMGGTLSSTFLTLLIIPCFYILLARLSEKFFGIPDEDEETGKSAPPPVNDES